MARTQCATALARNLKSSSLVGCGFVADTRAMCRRLAAHGAYHKRPAYSYTGVTVLNRILPRSTADAKTRVFMRTAVIVFLCTAAACVQYPPVPRIA